MALKEPFKWIAGDWSEATIGATETLLLSASNSIGFGDKFVSVKDFAISVATSAVIFGGISGITAVRQGQNFFKGSYVSIPKTPAPEPGQLSEDLIVDFPKNETQLAKPVSENPNISEIVHKIDEEIVDYEKIRRLADELGPHLRTPEVNERKIQEVIAVMEDENYKLHFRIETHANLHTIFPQYSNKEMIRHMNVELLKPNNKRVGVFRSVDGKYYKNYHLNLKE